MYFTDENSLGLGKLLRQSGRDDIVYPGHEDIPQIPLGALDLDWMPIVGRLGLIVLTRDRRIRTRPAELTAYNEHGLKSVWIGAKRDLTPQDQMALFMRHEARLRREATKRGPGPWALAMTEDDVRPLHLRRP